MSPWMFSASIVYTYIYMYAYIAKHIIIQNGFQENDASF